MGARERPSLARRAMTVPEQRGLVLTRRVARKARAHENKTMLTERPPRRSTNPRMRMTTLLTCSPLASPPGVRCLQRLAPMTRRAIMGAIASAVHPRGNRKLIETRCLGGLTRQRVQGLQPED